ncbi:MAG: DNA polymerase ligase N-terminal domain-containing protein [Isosphaeraceae bacterium]
MPRFALLEHRWNGVHWDFMLERPETGTLRTWAIDAPIEPERELPARALADHRLDYLDYEGEVSGGRGSVRRVDRGEYTTVEWEKDRVVVRVEGVQLVGLVGLTAVRNVGKSGESVPRGLNWAFRFNSGNFD